MQAYVGGHDVVDYRVGGSAGRRLALLNLIFCASGRKSFFGHLSSRHHRNEADA